MNETFLNAINQKLIIRITFNSYEKGIITRNCIPYDFGPGSKTKDGLDRYHFCDIDSTKGKHTLSILPDQLIDILLTDTNFNPEDYITWTPSWIIKRDWGKFS